MVLGTRGGYLQVVSWDGTAKICVDALAWATNAVPSPTSSPSDASNETATPVAKPSIVQVAANSGLGLVAFVFSDGSAGVCDASLLRPAATSSTAASASTAGGGILLLQGGSNAAQDERATRVAFNERYRLLAVGVESGDVLVYRVEPPIQQSGGFPPQLHLPLLRRYSISPWGFTARDIGVVQCMEWSPDGSCCAVGWSGRGLVVWSTGGTRVACTLPMLSPLATLAGMAAPSQTGERSASFSSSLPPSYASSAPHAVAPPSELLGNGVTALGWGCAGASILVSGKCNDIAHGFGSIKLKSKSWNDVSSDQPTQHSSSSNAVLPSAEARCGCGLVTRLSFVRSCLSSNPSQNEQTSLTLLGEDRIVLWAGKRSLASSGAAAASSVSASAGIAVSHIEEEIADDLLHANWESVQRDEEESTNDSSQSEQKSNTNLPSTRRSRRLSNEDRFLDSDSDWEHIQLPAVYMTHAWPLKHCAISGGGYQIACAGAQGLILYNRSPSFAVGASAASAAPHTRKWRRFGNVNHEEAVHAAGLSWYGEHVVCVASRGAHQVHQMPGRTSRWSPPPAAAAKRAGQGVTSAGEADCIELLFYPRSHLDNSALLHTHVLTHASSFHSVDIADHTLMVYLAVGQLLVYRLHAEVHLNPNSVRKAAASPQAALLAQLMQAAGGARAAPLFPVPYSTAPHAHPTLGMEHEVRMAMELAYVVDLCAPLAPVRSLDPRTPPTYQYDDAPSLHAMLATPPLQCRLWLNAADSLDQTEELHSASRESPLAASDSTIEIDGGVEEQQVYELPLFCPNSQLEGLEALFQATTPNPAAMHSRRGSRVGNGTATPSNGNSAASSSRSIRKATKVLSCIILTATGTLLAVDIGESMKADTSIHSPPPSTPSPSRAGMKSRKLAWVRIVSRNVEQFWLHDMAATDPMHSALQYLHSQRTAQMHREQSITATAAENSSSVSPAAKRAVRGLRLFSYGSNGLDVWFRLSSSSSFPDVSAAPPSFRANTLLDFDAEVYPLGLDSSIGVIVGITKGLRTRSAQTGVMLTPAASATPRWTDRRLSSASADKQNELESSPFWGPVVCFRLQTQLQPYLHGVLMHLVTNEHAAPITNAEQQTSTEVNPLFEVNTIDPSASPPPSGAALAQLEYAYSIANSCRTHVYFPVALELLLHQALNPPASARFLRRHKSASLSSVVSFLRRFPEFPDVVINCARKNDASCWSRLFRCAGTPQELFELCMKQGKLRMASCYLLVLQRTAGMKAAREAATSIVQRIEQEEGAVIELSTTTASDAASTNTATSASSSSLSAPTLPPSFSSSPSVVFRRRRRLSALESELHRFITLTHGMEAEMVSQALAAQAEAAARARAAQAQAEKQVEEQKNGRVDASRMPTTPNARVVYADADAQSDAASSLPIVSPARRSSGSKSSVPASGQASQSTTVGNVASSTHITQQQQQLTHNNLAASSNGNNSSDSSTTASTGSASQAAAGQSGDGCIIA